MLKKVNNIIFAGIKYYCVGHCITEHVGDVFLVSTLSIYITGVLQMYQKKYCII